MNPDPNSPILPLTCPAATLENAGGKGLHLVEMAAGGLPVPPGFIIATSAYLDFVRRNQLLPLIHSTLARHPNPAPADLEAMSQTIRAAFARGAMPAELQGSLLAAYQELGAPAVAVRSSATAEDLPDLSFAGQQDTYLNVTTPEILTARVIDCWASLWTARAIGYRLRQGVDQQNIALAVVVQQMVQSDVSGVLFSANPLNGSRVECVIDATFGLGEALVSGQVEPDHYVVDVRQNQILARQIGRKAISIRASANGGVQQVQEPAQNRSALTDEQILQLSALGQNIQSAFGSPQDVEWAFSNGELYLLQTRPITSLFPLPGSLPPEPLKVLISFAAVQGMVDPVTPIGQSALKQIFAWASHLFNIMVTETTQTVLFTAGERLWVNMTSIIRNTAGRKALPYVFEMVEPTIRQAVEQIKDDPRLQPEKEGISLRARGQMARFLLPAAANVIMNLLSPVRRRRKIIEQSEMVLRRLAQNAADIHGDRFQKLEQQTRLLDTIAKKYLGRTFIMLVSGVASGMASWNFLRMLTRGVNGQEGSRWNDLILNATRGMPNNPTTEMDLRLWEMARAIKSDPAALGLMRGESPRALAGRFLAGELPELILHEVDGFLQKYGGRGLCEIDLGRCRWAEDPTHVFEMLVNFLKIENENDAPDAVFSRGQASAEASIQQLITGVRAMRGGFVKSGLVRFFAGRMRQLMGMRETPKFFAVRMMWIIQREIKKTGAEFVAAGELTREDDLFYLSFPELQAFAARQPRDWQQLMDARRALYEREKQRRQLPRLLLSDGRAFYEGMSAPGQPEAHSVIGSPVSPGVVQGQVRVVLDPSQAHLAPGEIMVCPGTDPSWTPLFLVASGLVMEVGGMMTHGAVVAREYGIPAVVGVHQATTRLQTGMRIRLNGSTGEIALLD